MIMKCVVSIDWLQIYIDCSLCSYDSDYGWKKQGYQTQTFRNVFELQFKGEMFGSAVSDPTSSIIDKSAMIVKISNRNLYGQNLSALVLGFLESNRLIFKSFTRIDICADFQVFNENLQPETFIKRYLAGVYVKSTRGKFSLAGSQNKGCVFEYLRFGSKTSEINTYMYNKTKELRENKDKPYIRELWARAGLGGSRDVWRLEVSIKGQGMEYVSIDGGLVGKIGLETLSCAAEIERVYCSYIAKHFAFKINDSCGNVTRMKKLNLIDLSSAVYMPIYLPNVTGSNRADKIFLKKLYALDTELRGLSDIGVECQKQLVQDFAIATDLTEYMNDRKISWKKDVFREN